jgi:hypothetical protein
MFGSTLVLLAAAATAPAVTAPAVPTPGAPLDYAAAKALADKQEAAMSPALARALRDAQQKRVDRAFDVCMTEGRPTAFNIVLELDAAGKTTRHWRDSDTVLAQCVERQVAAQPFYVPDAAPFYTFFEFTFTP